MRSARLVAAAALLMLAGGWGGTGHRIINGQATKHLPPPMAAFIAQTAWLADSSSVADWRRSGSNGYVAVPTDAPKHYLDVDDYPEHATRSVTTDLAALIAKYGSARVTDNGTLPWAVGASMDTLTAAMQRRDLRKVWSTASDLGHYVADGHNPLHCTVDYNGRASLPGSAGIHSRYETSMVNRHSASLTIVPDTVTYVNDVVAFALGFVYDSQALVDTLYAADVSARTTAGWSGSGTVPTAYLDAMWAMTGSITRERFQSASTALGSLLYTAWVNAGSPDLSGVTSVGPSVEVPAAVALFDAYPNPFNPLTTVTFELREATSVRLEIVGLDGRVLGTLVDGALSPGRHLATVDASRLRLSSGIYFVRLHALEHDRTLVRRSLLLR